ncbi:MAG: hypothetical protein ABI378_00515 [Chitinophagaceae bacterium]
MKKLITLALLLLVFGYSSKAQRNFKFSQSTSGDNISKKNVLTGNLGLGGFGIGVFIGIDYERIFGESGKISLTLPLYYVTSGDHFMEVAGDGDRFHNHNAFFIAPGIRYYPFGAFHIVDFGMAAQVAIGSLSVKEESFNRGNINLNYYSSLLLTPILQLNVNFTGRANFGLFLARGLVIAGDFGYNGNSGNKIEAGFFQVGMKFGGRF